MIFAANIPAMLRFLGARKDRWLILSSICLVVITFFYFFVIGSTLQTRIYTFHYRVTYENLFAANVITPNIDMSIVLAATIAWCYFSIKLRYWKAAIITLFSFFLLFSFLNLISVVQVGALSTLPFVIAIIIRDRFRNRSILRHQYTQLSMTYIAMVSIGLAASGIISLFLFPLMGVTNVTANKYPYSIFQELLGILTPLIIAVLIFCIPFKIVLHQLLKKLNVKEELILFDITRGRLSTKWIVASLTVCIMLGITIALIPHLLIVNPNNERLGVDTPSYVEWLNTMKKQVANPINFVLASPEDRPLTLIILFLITEATQADPFLVVEYSPVFLTPLLVLITFFLTRQLTDNDGMSIIAAFLSAISFQTIIGIYSGFYANWLALVLGYSAFTLILRYLKAPSNSILLVIAVVVTGVLLAHLYTWSIIILVAFIFLFVLQMLHYYPRKRFLLLYLILSSSIVVDILKSSLTGAPTGLEADVSVGFSHGFGLSQFSERFRTLAETIQTYYGGGYANIAILGLVMYWLVRCKIKEMANIFVLIFLSSALIPLFLGDWVLQSRVLYNIPFQIPAAISLYTIWKEHHKIVFIAILLIASYLSLHVLANLGYVPLSYSSPLIDR